MAIWIKYPIGCMVSCILICTIKNVWAYAQTKVRA